MNKDLNVYNSKLGLTKQHHFNAQNLYMQLKSSFLKMFFELLLERYSVGNC